MQEYRDIEHAIVFLVNAFEGTVQHKPTILHSIRCGLWLKEQGFPADIVIAGILHDVVEDTPTAITDISREFGENVAAIVAANTKDSKIKDANERREDLIKRCRESLTDALVVKIADVYDNYQYYSNIRNEEGINYCKEMCGYIREALTIFWHTTLCSNDIRENSIATPSTSTLLY